MSRRNERLHKSQRIESPKPTTHQRTTHKDRSIHDPHALRFLEEELPIDDALLGVFVGRGGRKRVLDRRSPLADVVDDAGVCGGVDGVGVNTGDVPVPGMRAGKALCGLDRLDHGCHVEVAGEEFGVDDGVCEGVSGVQDDRAACVKQQVSPELQGGRGENIREVGETTTLMTERYDPADGIG